MIVKDERVIQKRSGFQAGNLQVGLSSARLHVDLCVEAFRLKPELLRLLRVAGVAFEKGVSPDSVCQVKRIGLPMGAVDLQGFFVTMRRQVVLFLVAEDIRDMTDGVGKSERAVEGSVQCDNLLIVFESDVVLM